jgi:hypothetical protein
MALPASGTISMNDIRVELGFPSQSPFSLYSAETGSYVLLNKCSTYVPNGSTPDSMAEWYSYNHTQQCPSGNCDVSEYDLTRGIGTYNIPILIGVGEGTIWLTFYLFNAPSKFQVIYNSTTVIDTGFRGSSSYNSALNALGYPNVSGPGVGSASFIKAAPSPTTANVIITSPLNPVSWQFTLSCPQTTYCFGYDTTNCTNACSDYAPSCL